MGHSTFRKSGNVFLALCMFTLVQCGIAFTQIAPRTGYIIDGATVVSPNQPDWSVWQPTKLSIAFLKAGPAGGESTVASVLPIQAPNVRSDQEYLQYIKSLGPRTNYGEDPSRFVVVSASERLSTFNGQSCVSYRRVSQDLRPPSNSTGPQFLKVIGYYCRRPEQPGLGTETTYSNRSGLQSISSAMQRDASAFFAGVRFKPFGS